MLVTGQTNSSRLSELRKYTISDDVTKRYVGNGSWNKNGVDFSQLIYDELNLFRVVYYIDGIKFTDHVLEGITTFQYNAVGTDNPNFIHLPYFKDPKKEDIVSKPKIDNDVFIIRQQVSAFEKNYLLEHIDSLVDLRTFVGGNYFNIVNNT